LGSIFNLDITCPNVFIVGGDCSTACPTDGYFVSGKACEQCFLNCKVCTGPQYTDCTECMPTYGMKNQLCIRCPEGYIGATCQLDPSWVLSVGEL